MSLTEIWALHLTGTGNYSPSFKLKHFRLETRKYFNVSIFRFVSFFVDILLRQLDESYSQLNWETASYIIICAEME
jgi:hypothetical protein